jgi:hypothetical protein
MRSPQKETKMNASQWGGVTAHATVIICQDLRLSTKTETDTTWSSCCLNLGRSLTFRRPLSPSSRNDALALLLQMTTHIHNRSTATCRRNNAKRFSLTWHSILCNIDLNGPHSYMLFRPTPSLKGVPPCTWFFDNSHKSPKGWTTSLNCTGTQAHSDFTYSFHFFQDLPRPQWPFDSVYCTICFVVLSSIILSWWPVFSFTPTSIMVCQLLPLTVL